VREFVSLRVCDLTNDCIGSIKMQVERRSERKEGEEREKKREGEKEVTGKKRKRDLREKEWEGVFLCVCVT